MIISYQYFVYLKWLLSIQDNLMHPYTWGRNRSQMPITDHNAKLAKPTLVSKAYKYL